MAIQEKETIIQENSQNCFFNGNEIENGESVDAYKDSIVPANSSCERTTLTCDNGNFTGDTSYSFETCAVAVATTITAKCNQLGGPTNSTYQNINDDITVQAGETIPNCEWECNENYTKNGDSCVADTRQTESCSGDNGDETYAGTPKFTQTWNGTSWTPTTKEWTYTTNSNPGECEFTCPSDKEWDDVENECKDMESVVYENDDLYATTTTPTLNLSKPFEINITLNSIPDVATLKSKYLLYWDDEQFPVDKDFKLFINDNKKICYKQRYTGTKCRNIGTNKKITLKVDSNGKVKLQGDNTGYNFDGTINYFDVGYYPIGTLKVNKLDTSTKMNIKIKKS